MDAGRRYETPGSETKDVITHGQSFMFVCIGFSGPLCLRAVIQRAHHGILHMLWVMLQERNTKLRRLAALTVSGSKPDLCLGEMLPHPSRLFVASGRERAGSRILGLSSRNMQECSGPLLPLPTIIFFFLN